MLFCVKVFDKQPDKKKKGNNDGMILYKQISMPALAPWIDKSVFVIKSIIHIKNMIRIHAFFCIEITSFEAMC